MNHLILNKAQCLFCNDIIESTWVHDFKSCTCGKTSVDGGLEYTRRLYNYLPSGEKGYKELSEYE